MGGSHGCQTLDRFLVNSLCRTLRSSRARVHGAMWRGTAVSGTARGRPWPYTWGKLLTTDACKLGISVGTAAWARGVDRPATERFGRRHYTARPCLHCSSSLQYTV